MKRKPIIKIIALVIIGVICFNSISFASEFSSTIAAKKITEDVSVKLKDLSSEERISVYVHMVDDSESVLETMASKYPQLHATYTKAKFTNEAILTNAADATENERKTAEQESVELQSAIEVKRQLYRTHYTTRNEATLKAYCSPENFLYVSSYAPMAIVSVTAQELKEMALEPAVAKISLFQNGEVSNSSLYNSNLNSRASYVRDTYGNDGTGVKIGQIELAVPNVADIYLTSSNITTNTTFGGEFNTGNTNHATYVARIMVGSTGVAPSATLYAASINSLSSTYQAIDWLVAQGVNVINMSANFYYNYGYDVLCAHVDHLAVQHDVHFVVSSGNHRGDLSPNLYVCSPGMAYNAITVGAYHDNNTAPANDSQIYAKQKDDYISPISKYLEGSPNGNVITGTNKPNLMASGNGFVPNDNKAYTSYAAPQVAGVIAQLCSYDSSLKTKQSSMGAILMASCGRKLANEVVANTEIVSSGSYKGGEFINSVRIDGNPQISNTQGAGKLDAYWARTIVAADNYRSVTLLETENIYEKTVYITKDSETLTRVAIFWLKRNDVDSQYNISQIALPDWDLSVYDPNGVLVGSSMTYDCNYEIVQFVPPESGYYKIRITKYEADNEKSYVGIAVW